MDAGVVRGRLRLDQLDESVEAFREALPAFLQIPGCTDVQFWLDRGSGEAVGVGMYETAEARAAAERVVAESLRELAGRVAGPLPQREFYHLESSAATIAQTVVERGLQAINEGDMERFARDLAPDILYRAPGPMELRGVQAVKEHYQRWHQAFPDGRFLAGSIVATGRTVVANGEFTGTHAGTLPSVSGDIPATGRTVRSGMIQIFTVDRGLIAGIQTYGDTPNLMRQLGLTSSEIRTTM